MKFTQYYVRCLRRNKMKRIEPNLKDWAEAILYGLEYKDVNWLEAELNEIADKYYQMGSESLEQSTDLEEVASNLLRKIEKATCPMIQYDLILSKLKSVYK